MVRTWEDRVRGASQRVEMNQALGSPDGAETGPTGVDAVRGDHLLVGALTLALDTLGVPLVVVERLTGLIQWQSQEWIERFGRQQQLSRHLPSTTELGETPLPPPGEQWRRTRSVSLSSGGEELFDLVMSGAATSGGIEYVTVVALDRAGPGAAVSDRGEVTATIDGALKQRDEKLTAVLFVDMDRFKVVHDLVGQAEAMRLLDRVYRRISGSVRTADVVFRLHSDEFVVVASDIGSAAEAAELADRVRSSVAVVDSDDLSVALTASVGVAFSEEVGDGEAVLSAAETAVRLAKGRGRNRVAIHDEELRARNERMLNVERHLRDAIENRSVRFLYQPMVDIESGTVLGGEALLRLGGEIGLSAVEVVNAAEHSGLMGDLGALVIDGVVQQLGRWLNHDTARFATINLSAAQVADDKVLDALHRAVDTYGIMPGQLGVEVAAAVLDGVENDIARLRDEITPTVLIGVDGYGSLGTQSAPLATLGVDYVKLHRSLVASVLTDDRARQRIRAVLAEAAASGLRTIALGVERAEHASTLAALGCATAQGFYYAGAVDADTLMSFEARPLEASE